MLLTLTLLTGCVTGTSSEALCDGLSPLADSHVEALLEDGGEKSTVAGANLVKALDAGCKKNP